MKNNHNRAISLLLAIVLTFTLAATALAADPDDGLEVTWNNVAYSEEMPLATDFSDTNPGDWFYNDVMNCAKLGIVAGFSDGKFKPNDTVTYAQYVVMLSRTFYNKDVEAVTDTAGKPWYYPNMKAMNDKNLLKGSAIVKQGGWPTVVVANDNVNRYDMAQIAACVISNNGKSASESAKNAVPSQLADWAQIEKDRPTAALQTCVKTCVAAGIINGIDGKFAGNQSMTRAQACTVMMRMLKLINNYNPGDADNSQYDDGKSQDTGSSNQTSTSKTLANGQPITEANIKSIISQVRSEYPTGTIWGFSNTAGTKSYSGAGTDITTLYSGRKTLNSLGQTAGSISSQYGCGGFAALVSERIFGKTGFPARQVTEVSKVRLGDIVITVDSNGYATHVAIVTELGSEVCGDGVTRPCFKVSDGNYPMNGTRIIQWSQDVAGIYGSFNLDGKQVYTRYPA